MPQTHTPLDFDLLPQGSLSKIFWTYQISTFSEATEFVRQLRYGRNENKANLTTLFTDNCGTCSTKHALLKQLADEHNVPHLKLMLGIFKMNASNTPKIAKTLAQHQLDYIPEAHNYLNYKDQILDFTNKTSKAADFAPDLMEEIEIDTDQITDFKVHYHQQFLSTWLEQHKSIPLTLAELWKIREQCIADLSKKE